MTTTVHQANIDHVITFIDLARDRLTSASVATDDPTVHLRAARNHLAGARYEIDNLIDTLAEHTRGQTGGTL